MTLKVAFNLLYSYVYYLSNLLIRYALHYFVTAKLVNK